MVNLALPRIPVARQKQLGEIVVIQFAREDTHCADRAQVAALYKILTTTAVPVKRSPNIFGLIVVDGPAVNAAAGPSFYRLLFRGLRRQAEHAEGVVGGLAHDVQHILRQHTAPALLQPLSTSVLFSHLVGDASGPLGSALEGVHMLNILRRHRSLEEEAYRKTGQPLLDAGVDPHGIPQFCNKFE